MVGDWVAYDNANMYITQIKEIRQTQDGKEFFITCYRDSRDPLYEKYKLDFFNTKILHPIPLNAEILEKNGFNKESDFRWSAPDIKKYCIVNEKVFDGQDSWWFCFNVPDKHKLGHICLFECGNVHELQHILKSGKSNIKIEL